MFVALAEQRQEVGQIAQTLVWRGSKHSPAMTMECVLFRLSWWAR
jgi:hypothetical protein